LNFLPGLPGSSAIGTVIRLEPKKFPNTISELGLLLFEGLAPRRSPLETCSCFDLLPVTIDAKSIVARSRYTFRHALLFRPKKCKIRLYGSNKN
jgi:hypothetical protein